MCIFIRLNGLEQEPCASTRPYSVLKFGIRVCDYSCCLLLVWYTHIAEFRITVWLWWTWGTKSVALRWWRHCPVRRGSKSLSADGLRPEREKAEMLFSFRWVFSAFDISGSRWTLKTSARGAVCCIRQLKLRSETIRNRRVDEGQD